jgi:hypothetical protein
MPKTREAKDMALKYQLDALDGVDEAAKGFYKEANGKFTLDVEGVESVEAVNGLKTALVRERENNGAYAKFGKPDEITARFAELEAKANTGGKATEDQQKIIDQMKAKYDAEIAVSNAKLAGTYSRQATSDLKAELAKVGVVPEGLDLLAGFAASRLKFNDDGSIKIMSADGSLPMIGDGANGGATLANLAKELAGAIPHLVKDLGAGGGGKPPGSDGGKPTIKTIKRDALFALPPAEQAQLMADGVKPID